jgi:hypothetical protein
MAVVLILTLLGLSCAAALAAQQSPEEQLAAAEAKWAGNKPHAYEFGIEHRFCCVIRLTTPMPQWPVFHVDGDRASLVSGDPALSNVRDLYGTVEKQFAFIRSKLVKRPYLVEIEYDSQLGYARRVYMKMFEHGSDDEYGFDIQGFKVVAR